MSVDLGLGDVLRAITELVLRSTDQIRATRDAEWDEVLSALRLLENITGLHVKAVVYVCDPILESGDIVATARAYRRLVDNADFPTGYGLVKGALTAAYGMSEFKKPAIHQVLGDLLGQVHAFQVAGFMIGFGSGVAADSLDVAVDLYTLAQSVDDSEEKGSADRARLKLLQDDASKRFDAMFSWLDRERGQQASPRVHEPTTAAEVVRLGQEWARQWKAHVQLTLYGGRGLHYSIGQLRMAARHGHTGS